MPKRRVELVIDTNILKGATTRGAEDPQHPGYWIVQFLNGVLKICHGIVVSDNLEREYRKKDVYRCRFSAKWLTQMFARKAETGGEKASKLPDVNETSLKKCLEDAGFDPKDIPWVLLASSTEDKIFVTNERHSEKALEAARRIGVEVISPEEAYRRFVEEWGR